MIDIAEKGTDWIRRWGEVTFTPSKLFGFHGFRLDSTAFLFAIGCIFAGYFSATVSAVAYFAIWYPGNLRAHLTSDKFKETIEILTAIAGVYVTAYLVTLLVTASISYLVFRAFGTGRPFEDHFAAELHLFSLEPVAAVSLTVLIINRNNHRLLLSGIMFAIFVATRLYYLVLAYVALRSVHRLSSKFGTLAFCLGYVPPAAIGLLVQVGITWLLGIVDTSHMD
jgi:hypothetical protein